MKKGISLLLVLFLMFNLNYSVFAADNNPSKYPDMQKIQKTLQKQYPTIETSLGKSNVIYKIIRKDDYFQIQITAEYDLFNNIQFGEHKLKEKQQATEEIKDFCESICNKVCLLYPNARWSGFITCDFESICGYMTSRIFFNWRNYIDDIVLDKIMFQEYLDDEFTLAICEWLEKK